MSAIVTLRRILFICWPVLFATLNEGVPTAHAGHGGCCGRRVLTCDAYRGCHGWYEHRACYGLDYRSLRDDRPAPQPPPALVPKKDGGPPEPPKEEPKKAEAKPLAFRPVTFRR